MRYALITAALLASAALTARAAVAFDMQNSGAQPGGSANLAPDATAVPGVSVDDDLRAQLGLADNKAIAASKSGLQFGGGVFSGSASTNSTSMSYDDRPWIAPRKRPGQD